MYVHTYTRDESDSFIQTLIHALQFVNTDVEQLICC